MYLESSRQLIHETDDVAYFFTHAYDSLNNCSAHAVDIGADSITSGNPIATSLQTQLAKRWSAVRPA
jgi:hypothetical protein